MRTVSAGPWSAQSAAWFLPSLRSGFPTEEPNGADKRSSSGRCSFQVISLPIHPLIHPLTFLFLPSFLPFPSFHPFTFLFLPSLPFVHLSIHPLTFPFLPSIHSSTYLSIHPSTYLSFHLSIHRTFTWHIPRIRPCVVCWTHIILALQGCTAPDHSWELILLPQSFKTPPWGGGSLGL